MFIAEHSYVGRLFHEPEERPALRELVGSVFLLMQQ